MGRVITTPLLLALLAIGIWSFGPALGRFVSLKTQFLLTAVAYTFAFIILFSYFYWTNKKDFVKKLKQVELKYLLIGLFGYSIFSLSFIQTFRAYNSASEPTILNYTWPVFMVLFVEIFFRIKKRKPLLLYWIEGIGIFLGFIAIVLLITQGNLTTIQITNPQGLLWGILTGASYGFFSAYSSTVPKEKQSLFLLAAIASSLIFTTFLSLTEISLLSTLTITDVAIAMSLGIFVNGVAYIAWTKAMHAFREKQIAVSSVASLTFFLPVLSLLIIAILFKERTLFTMNTLLVVLLLLLSSVLCQKAERIAKLFRNKK